MRIAVDIRGSGPDLVLLHGWALHGGTWGPWTSSLQQSARLHLVDLPGHGHSDWADGLRGLADFARVLRPHVPRGATVLGWSLGGMIALELARQAPRQLTSLVLIATTPKFVSDSGWDFGLRAEVLDEFARGLDIDYRRTVQSFLALQTRGDERSLETLRALRRGLDERRAPDPRALAAGLDILRGGDLRDDLPRITVPTLVISGANDRLTPPEAGRALAAALPAARFRLVEHSGHAPFLSHGSEVLREIGAFLGRHRPAVDNCGAKA